MRYLLSHAKGWVERLQTLSLFAAATGILLGIPVSGCSSDLQRKGAQEVRIGAFESSDATVDTPGAVDAAADAEGKTVVIEREEAMSSGTRGMKSTQRIIETDGQIDSEVDVFEMRAPVGDRYTIDGLVGQINGRPIYADEFLIPIADRIMRIASDPNIPRPTAIAEVEKLVALRFNDVVDSELIVAEAESSLSPEMQQGIFGWLQSIQEQTIAERGGTRATAEASIGEEFQISLDEFLEERRTVALAMNLLRKRIEPRAIVSWRDVEQEYRRRWSEYNPPALMRIGRIRFSKTRQAEQIEEAKAIFAKGGSFKDAVAKFDIADDGFWLEVERPQNGIQGTKLAPAIKDRLEDLQEGMPSVPLEQTAFMSWFTVMSVERPDGRSIYTTSVQIQLESYLRNIRERQERARYIASLRSRWINDDISKMQVRLVKIAKDRYLPD